MSWWGNLVHAVRGALGAGQLAGDGDRIVFSQSGPIDALVSGLTGSAAWDRITITRADALSVAAIKRGRDQIASIATYPLRNYRGIDVVPSTFLATLDPDVPRVVHLAQTIEDLLCVGVAWWLKLGLDYRGYPLAARRLDPGTVSMDPPEGRSQAPLPSGIDPRGGVVWVDGEPVPGANLIRFDSPNQPLLTAGARTIRRAIVLDLLAAMYAENPRPLDAFTDSDDMSVREYTPDEVAVFLATWRRDRRKGGTAWIPKAVKRTDINAPSPAELQLVELQRQVTLELANLIGIDAEEVGVSTTSRSYFNGTDRDKSKVNTTLAPYLAAVSDRLSMGDITPRGQAVRWDLTDLLKPDPATQAAYWRALWDMEAIDSADVRAFAGIPGKPPAPRVQATVAPVQAALPAPAIRASIGQGQPVPAITSARFAGDDGPAMRFSLVEFDGEVEPPKVDEAARTITGLALPYGATARKFGEGFRFKPGSLEYDAGNLARLKTLKDHHTPVGIHQGVTDSAKGPVVTLHVLGGPEGPIKAERDQLLHDAKHGLYDGLSVGVDFSLDPRDGDVEYDAETRTYTVLRASWRETSVTPMPAFDDARVTSVAASRSGGFTMHCQHCGHPHGPGISCHTYAQLQSQQTFQQPTAPAPAPGTPAPTPGPGPGAPAPTPGQAPQAFTAEQLTAALNQAVQAQLAAGQVAAAPPTAAAVNPTVNGLPGQPPPATGPQGFARATVTEPDPYVLTFSRKGEQLLGRGTHDFSSDFYAYFTNGDVAAYERALGFVRKHFDVAVADVNELNPTRQRPDMWVDQANYKTPLWDAINKGSLSDITPFMFPKFSSASGLVAAHTPGVEPASGTYVTTAQTVTPTGYSGKAKIHREVWDQGGNPQISTLIWQQMVKGKDEALEAAAVTLLNAGSYTALATLTAGVVDRAVAGRVLFREISQGIALLQFARGGFRFTDAFGQADLYLALAGAESTTGEPLLPMYGATNRNGTSQARFGALDLAGMPLNPEWALAAAGQVAATKSYMLDRGSVHGWASPPQRLTFDQTEVANVYLGIWGYQATAVSDDTGVRTITWDPVA